MSDLSTNTRHQFFIKRLKELGMYDIDSDYDGKIGYYIEDISATFANQGHSGQSAMITISLFNQLMMEYMEPKEQREQPILGED